MGNRMLRDWTRSDKIDKVSDKAERFFTRLIMKVDDYGCYYAHTGMLKADLFPLKLDSIREADITRWMAECQKAGLIVLYESKNKKYLQILDFKQRLDRAKAKFPLPDESREIVNDLPPENEVENEVEKEEEISADAPGDSGSGNLSPKKMKEERTPGAEIQMPFGPEFLNAWANWLQYKKDQFKFKYKSLQSEQAALNELVGLSGNNEQTAIAIINQSIAKTWRGLFELKQSINGTSYQQPVIGNQNRNTEKGGTSTDRIEALRNW
ncbi:hypothetical protein ACLOAU_14490 [Niabella sp. CJ426]|uniref:hypothetical protein n=1 Tax=Niabella sp. CJ426 TaxID=3393740 RepID=UPI003D058E0A